MYTDFEIWIDFGDDEDEPATELDPEDAYDPADEPTLVEAPIVEAFPEWDMFDTVGLPDDTLENVV